MGDTASKTPLCLSDLHTLELVLDYLLPVDVARLGRAGRATFEATREAAARRRRTASMATLLSAAHRPQTQGRATNANASATHPPWTPRG